MSRRVPLKNFRTHRRQCAGHGSRPLVILCSSPNQLPEFTEVFQHAKLNVISYYNLCKEKGFNKIFSKIFNLEVFRQLPVDFVIFIAGSFECFSDFSLIGKRYLEEIRDPFRSDAICDLWADLTSFTMYDLYTNKCTPFLKTVYTVTHVTCNFQNS